MAKTLDRFDLMRLYVRIAETGSVSAAGRSLGLSQPSASRQLRELEAELGTQLIMRTTHDLSFTEVGQEFLADARRLLGEWEAVLERTRLQKGEIQGRIRVAAPSGVGQTIMADIAGSFVERHPLVSIEWRLDDSPRDLIAEGIDLWVRVGPIADESLIVRGLWRIERIVTASTGRKLKARRPKDLVDEPAVVLGPYVGTEIDLAGPGGLTETLTPKVSISTNNIFAAERLTLSGIGYSILPLWLMQPSIDAKLACIVCPDWRPPPLTLSIAYPQSRYRPARVSAFIDHLKKELPSTGTGISPMK